MNSIESITQEEKDDIKEFTKDKLSVINTIPEILQDNTDRNRTSPFAFTGNRFEFRAVGSSVNVASSIFILNSAVAEQLKLFREKVDSQIENGTSHDEAILNVIREFLIDSKPIRFEGNGYSKEWIAEAKKRGLKGVTNVPESFKEYLTKESIEMFTSTNVLTEREVNAHYEIRNEIYTKKLQIEARDRKSVV